MDRTLSRTRSKFKFFEFDRVFDRVRSIRELEVELDRELELELDNYSRSLKLLDGD